MLQIWKALLENEIHALGTVSSLEKDVLSLKHRCSSLDRQLQDSTQFSSRLQSENASLAAAMDRLFQLLEVNKKTIEQHEVRHPRVAQLIFMLWNYTSVFHLYTTSMSKFSDNCILGNNAGNDWRESSLGGEEVERIVNRVYVCVQMYSR